MVTAHIRVRYTENSLKTLVHEESFFHREAQVEALCKSAGCRLFDIYVSMVTNENVNIVEGPIEAIDKVRRVFRRTGGFSSISVDILHHVRDQAVAAKEIKSLAAAFRPPNQDEIDRMLLDE